ncbi:hypothetical protein MF271_04895 [Deinococcus sp. KNUC1210]|uniref:hypothetical protein n=1 Tax=Deinococcus sp. KNUC1210 TaxID=2917691 RepID=UPI001EEFEFBA|nr:hypothetical protein [Deinococcus sp. KNUC1210]ULH15972.1 hypothetical protein MF271_04895 [Deinococcus sp. KNUC1210]
MNNNDLAKLIGRGRSVKISFDYRVNLISLIKLHYEIEENLFVVSLQYVGLPNQPFTDSWGASDILLELRGSYSEADSMLSALEKFTGKTLDEWPTAPKEIHYYKVDESVNNMLKSFCTNRDIIVCILEGAVFKIVNFGYDPEYKNKLIIQICE